EQGGVQGVVAGKLPVHVRRAGGPEKGRELRHGQSDGGFGRNGKDEAVVKEVGQDHGGQFFREEDLYKLPDAVKLKTDKVGWPVEIELWSTKLFFFFALAVATAEWILRKTAQLK